MQTLFMQSAAGLSDCGTYRYWLSRIWDRELPPVCWIMLNPSTADAMQDDATIRRCCDFAGAWGCGGIVVMNLFAFRATDPKELRLAIDPVGPDNDAQLRRIVPAAHVIAAWGNGGNLFGRSRAVLKTLGEAGVKVEHLGLTASGQPRHPLYLPKDTKPVLWDYQALLTKSASARL